MERHWTPYSKKELIELYQKRAKELGRLPRQREFQQVFPAYKYFGSFSQLQIEAGYKPYRLQRVKDPKGQIIREVSEVWDKLGRAPHNNEYNRTPRARNVFGSWANVIAATKKFRSKK